LALLLVQRWAARGVCGATTFVSLERERTAQERSALEQAGRISALVDAELARQLDLVTSLSLLPMLDGTPDLAAVGRALQRIHAGQPLWMAALCSI